MDEELEQTLQQRIHTNDQQIFYKLLNIINYQANTNQITRRYHLTPVRMAVTKIITGTNKDVEKLEL
jgi:hypothetical protein